MQPVCFRKGTCRQPSVDGAHAGRQGTHWAAPVETVLAKAAAAAIPTCTNGQ